jgi:hypothetical protein
VEGKPALSDFTEDVRRIREELQDKQGEHTKLEREMLDAATAPGPKFAGLNSQQHEIGRKLRELEAEINRLRQLEEIGSYPESIKAKAPKAPKWQDIAIRFVSDLKVQITIKNENCPPQNYTEMGFEDRRTRNPNKAWQTLKQLAESNGLITTTEAFRDRNIEKRMQEIRKTLRKFFNISDDPLPYIKGTGYSAEFKVYCSSSY